MAKGVFFLKPLALEVSGPLVEFAASNGEFEVRSGEADGAWEVHCSGALATSGVKWEHVDQVVTRGSATSAATVGALYDGFYSAGLQYGPGYRTLEQAWGADARAMSRLRMRLRWQGTAVHPADLDDALCTISITAVGGGGDDETRLPFAVDDAMLVGGVGELWAVRQRRGFPSLPHTLSVVVAQSDAEAASVWLGTLADAPRAQLGGFRERVLRADMSQRHLEESHWQRLEYAWTPVPHPFLQ
eukprot:2786457-Prymnesium_polylepis.1